MKKIRALFVCIHNSARSQMAEAGLDISQNSAKSVFNLLRADKSYHYVITVCDESQSERCPIFLGRTFRRHWSFVDPSSFKGTNQDKLNQTIEVRDKIRSKIEEFIHEIKDLTKVG